MRIVTVVAVEGGDDARAAAEPSPCRCARKRGRCIDTTSSASLRPSLARCRPSSWCRLDGVLELVLASDVFGALQVVRGGEGCVAVGFLAATRLEPAPIRKKRATGRWPVRRLSRHRHAGQYREPALGDAWGGRPASSFAAVADAGTMAEGDNVGRRSSRAELGDQRRRRRSTSSADDGPDVVQLRSRVGRTPSPGLGGDDLIDGAGRQRRARRRRRRRARSTAAATTTRVVGGARGWTRSSGEGSSSGLFVSVAGNEPDRRARRRGRARARLRAGRPDPAIVDDPRRRPELDPGSCAGRAWSRDEPRRSIATVRRRASARRSLSRRARAGSRVRAERSRAGDGVRARRRARPATSLEVEPRRSPARVVTVGSASDSALAGQFGAGRARGGRRQGDGACCERVAQDRRRGQRAPPEASARRRRVIAAPQRGLGRLRRSRPPAK